MRIAFVGATRLSARCLDEIATIRGCSVVGVVTNRETFRISYSPGGVRNVLYEDMVAAAGRHGIPSYVMQERMTEVGLRQALASWKPDFILVIGWYHMIPKEIRNLAPFGCAAIHASLLPRYRGGAPLVWAIINGERETGVSFFHLGDGVDDGDLIGQKSFDITPTDTIVEILGKCEEATAGLLQHYLPMIQAGTAPRIPQDESRATVFPQRSPQDGRIDCNWPAKQIEAFIRAQTKPYPGAFIEHGAKRIIIWDATIEDMK